ncbi:MAG: hypothetical protein RJB14_2214, partial [Pseudomonadota bacterium]
EMSLVMVHILLLPVREDLFSAGRPDKVGRSLNRHQWDELERNFFGPNHKCKKLFFALKNSQYQQERLY